MHKLFLVVGFVMLFATCERHEPVPYTYVNLELNVHDADMTDLQIVGGYAYIQGGVKGIIVYRSETEKFIAYERCCPYKPSDACERVTVTSSDIIVECECCGSQFLLYDGSVVKGPTPAPLVQYDASNFDPFSGSLYIFNGGY